MSGATLSTSRLQLGKVVDIHYAGKSSDLVITGLHIDSQVGKGHNILPSRTILVCPKGKKSSLGVKLREMQAINTKVALAMPKNSTL